MRAHERCLTCFSQPTSELSTASPNMGAGTSANLTPETEKEGAVQLKKLGTRRKDSMPSLQLIGSVGEARRRQTPFFLSTHKPTTHKPTTHCWSFFFISLRRPAPQRAAPWTRL